MPKRRSDVTDTPSPEPESEQPETSEAKPKNRRNGVYVPLTESGEIDTARFSADARKKFELINGGLGQPGEASGFQMDRGSIPMLYDGVASALRSVLTMFKWPPDLTQFVAYTPEQKQALTEPTAKVIELFAPAWLANPKMQALAIFGMVFVSTTQEMLNNARTEYVKLPHVQEALRLRAEIARGYPAPETVAKGAAA